MRHRGLGLGLGLCLGAALAVGGAVGTMAQGNEMASGSLYAVDLASGRMSRVGTIGDGSPIVGLAIPATGPGNVFALTEDQRLLRFSPVVPSAILAEVAISGLPEGETLLGIDVRPVSSTIYAVGSSSTLYWIDPETGVAEAVGAPFTPAIVGEVVGFDFNPTVDRIRFLTDAGQNLRLNPETGQIGSNPDTGEPTIDSLTGYVAGDGNVGRAPNLVGAGYTNSVPDAEATVLYVIDAAQDVLAVQDPPNDGVLQTVGPLDIDIAGPIGFDIAPNGAAYAAR